MKRYRKAVFIVTYKKEKDKILYLVLKRKLHWKGWEFPKGGVKENETLMQAVIRELKEETSQNPVLINRFNIHGKYEYNKEYPDRKGFKGQDYQLFSAQIKSKKMKIDKLEHSSYKWLEFKEAIKLLTWKNQKKCLRTANKSLKN